MNNKTQYYERKVNYYETDKMGVVHHSNYARYLEETRIDLMAKWGVPYEYFEDRGLMIPVLELKSAFKSSARFGETLRIVAAITKVSLMKFQFSYKIYDEKMEVVKHTAESTHCFVDSEFKPVSLKKIMPEMYEKMLELQDNEWS